MIIIIIWAARDPTVKQAGPAHGIQHLHVWTWTLSITGT